MEMLLRRSLQTIRTLRDCYQSAGRQSTGPRQGAEPIAIIGMACRFPGGCSSPEKFWDFLKTKGDGVRDIPPERWDIEEYYDPKPGTPGKMYLRQANFLQEDVGEFDARFFKISPREAAEMDPQQRLLLELSWEALERAGQNVEKLRGSKTGVFIGIVGSDFGRLPRDPAKANPYRGTGSITCIASGRISHVLGLHGPALSVDTACSSSLVSLQLACDSLRNGKSDLALAGGVNVMLIPGPMISLCMMNALSADGRCHPFDGDGQGYGRAEGAGLVVLKRLSAALADNDPILAVVRSAVVNQDGPSSGLTVPNANAQRDLIREALDDAGLTVDDVSFVEAHGTGTALGDPIEIKAIQEALGDGRARDNPLAIGSVKGNVGHLEAAAGVCGLIKVVLCLQHKQIPAHVNLSTLNPRISLEQIPATIPTELVDWTPAGGKARVAGVNAFGFSGTNAHILLGEAPERRAPVGMVLAHPRPYVLTVSAKTEWAFQTLLRAYRDHLLAHPTGSLRDVCYTAAVCRSAFPRRVAFIAQDITDLCAQIDALLQGRPREDTRIGDAATDAAPAKIAFLFTNGAGTIPATLLEMVPTLRHRLEQCDALFRPHVGGSIFEALGSGRTAEAVAPGLQMAVRFSAPYAVGMVLRSFGVRPAAVWAATHEGRLAAGCIAGVLALEDAVALALDPEGAPAAACHPPSCRVLDPASGDAVKKTTLLNPNTWRQRSFEAADPEAIATALEQQGYRRPVCLGRAEDGGALATGALFGPTADQTLIRMLAELYCAGFNIDWGPLFGGASKPNKVPLPTYPFERKRYWDPLKPSAGRPAEGMGAAVRSENQSRSPLHGMAVTSPAQGRRLEYGYDLSLTNLPEIKDTHGIVHVGYFLEMLKRTAHKSFNAKSFSILEKSFVRALILSEEQTTHVRLVYEPNDDDTVAFTFYSETGANQWDLHVKGVLRPQETQTDTAFPMDMADAAKSRCGGHRSSDGFYQLLKQRSINLGPAVQWVDEIWFSPGEALARFKQPASAAQFSSYEIGCHPGILDACAQIFHATLGPDIPHDMRFMVVKWSDVTYFGPPADQTLWCHVLLEDEGVPKGSIRGSFDLFDGKGTLVASAGQNEMKGLKEGFSVRELKKMRETAKAQAQTAESEWRRKLDQASAEQKSAVLVAFLKQATAEVLSIPVADIAPGDSLIDLGMDSMTGILFQAAIERDLGVEVPLDSIIQGPTLTALAQEMRKDFPAAAGAAGETTVAHPAQNRVAATNPDLWFGPSRRRQTAARRRLFCFPYGGGGASIYAQWPDHLPADVDVCAIQLPHRENRLKEPAITDIETLVGILADVLEPRLDLPFAFYGHSMGALVAYRLAHHLWRETRHKAAHLFVGGFTTPLIHPNPLLARATAKVKTLGLDSFPTIEQVKSMTDDQRRLFARAFSGFNRIPDEEVELKTLLIPIFVGDLQLVASYRPQAEARFDIPITAFHGEDDSEVQEGEMAGWRDLTDGPFKLHILPGDHLFLQKDQSQTHLLRLISEELQIAQPSSSDVALV